MRPTGKEIVAVCSDAGIRVGAARKLKKLIKSNDIETSLKRLFGR